MGIKDCTHHYTGAGSRYIQKGRQEKERKTVPQAGSPGLSQPSSPDATSCPSSPDTHYPDRMFHLSLHLPISLRASAHRIFCPAFHSGHTFKWYTRA